VLRRKDQQIWTGTSKILRIDFGPMIFSPETNVNQSRGNIETQDLVPSIYIHGEVLICFKYLYLKRICET
jgi:hypothetical protein